MRAWGFRPKLGGPGAWRATTTGHWLALLKEPGGLVVRAKYKLFVPTKTRIGAAV